MTSICEKNFLAEVRLIHAQNKYLYIISSFKEKTQLKTKQIKQFILNKLESMGFPKLYWEIRISKKLVYLHKVL